MAKKRGEYDVIFAVDCETSGINFNHTDLTVNYQSVSWGVIAADAKTFEPIDELYVEIQHDPRYKWEMNAERIHGLSREYLEEHGLTCSDAAAAIGDFLIRNNGGDFNKPIILLGHNVAVFDRPFLKKLLHTEGLPLKFAHRCVDTNSISAVTVQEFNSDDLFSAFGFDHRDEHNALDDAKMALHVAKSVRLLWKNLIDNT